MKKYLILTLSILLSGLAFGQPLTGTKTIPGDYATIQAAISELNSQGVGSGGVTFDVDADHTESSNTNVTITATGTSANPIVFQKVGTGTNPLITRTDAGTASITTLGNLGDAIIRLDGTDYITFDGIDLAASNSGIDYGYFTYKTSATNGCQNVTIRNCAITLSKGTSGVVTGIYISNGPTSSSATGVTVSANSGRNENITLSGNSISNVHCGIYIRGYNSATLCDQNIIVGQSGAGNTINNFGGGSSATTYGIYFMYQNNASANYNIINNAGNGGSAHAGTLCGIYYSNGVIGAIEGNNNDITLANSGTYSMHWIYNGNTANSVTFSGNTFAQGPSFTSTSTSYIIYNSTGTANVTISNNQTSGNIIKTSLSGSLYCYNNPGSPTSGTETITNNVFTDITVSGSSIFYGISSATGAGQAKDIHDNTISDITLGSGTFYGIYSIEGSTSNIYLNTISNISSGGGLCGIQSGGTSSVTHNTYQNTIANLATSGSNSVVYGIYASTATNNNLYRNNIYNLSGSATGSLVNGIYVTSGTTITVYNNFISDLKAPAATGTNAVNGLNISGGTNVNAYFNTIYLNATSSGASFGTSGIYASATPTVILSNNIVVNKSVPGGSAYSAAYRRSSNILTSYLTSSNNNCFYQEPGTNCFTYVEGTAFPVVSPNVTQLTMANYKSYMATRDQDSFSEEPPFVNDTAIPYDLHIAAVTPTQCESGGITISSPAITTDFDGNNRYPNAPYPDDPGFPAIAPDIGADEFAGKHQDLIPPNINYTALPNTTLFGDRTITATITDLSGVPTSGIGLPRLFWKKNTASYDTVQGVSIGSNQYTFTFGNGVTVGDIVSYYICAQDESPAQNVGSFPSAGAAGFSVDPPACSTPPTSPSTYTIFQSISGAVTVGSGGTYTSLTGAGGLFADINAKLVTGNITATIISDLTEDGSNALNQFNEEGAGGYTLTIQPDGTTPRIISGTYTGGLIRLNGADRVTFDGNYSGSGRYLTFRNNTTSTASAVFHLISLGAGQGATNNSIKNCNIIGGSNTVTSFFDIFMGSSTIGTSGNGADNDNNAFIGNEITKAYYGIGIASTNAITENINIANNIIGSDVATDYITAYGIYLTGYNSNSIISGNEIKNMIWDGNKYGIYFIGNNTFLRITKNVIHGFGQTGTGSAYYCSGIYDYSASNSDITIDNNMIYNLKTYGSTTAYYLSGIMLISGGTNKYIYNNSIHLYGAFGSSSAVKSACLYMGSTGTNFDVRNNIFSNVMTGGGTPINYAVYSVATHTNLTLNHNDYYTTGAAIGYYGADIANFSLWQTATGQDVSSFSSLPEFTSNTDLHINSGLTMARLESAGAIIAGFDSDIDGDVRPGPAGSVNGGASSYDVGADEFDGVPAPVMTYVSSYVTQTDLTYVLSGSTNNQVIGIQVVTSGVMNALTVSEFSLNTTGTTDPATDIENAKIFYTGTSSTFNASAQFGSTVAVPSGNFTITGTQLLSSGTNYFWLTYDVKSTATSANVIDAQCTSVKVESVDRTPDHTAPAGNREILTSLSGIYTVGAVGDFYTLNSAFAAANQLGLSGNVTFNIISDITETSMAVLNQWAETPSGSNYTMLIQPSGGAWTVDGSITSALIKLYGADRITLDGLNTGGNSLTLRNNSTSISTSVIWLSSPGAGQGATNNTIKNCTITGGSSTVSSFFDIFMGGTSVSTSGTGADNHNNSIIDNVLTKSYFGIYASGVATTGIISNLMISGNIIGSSTVSEYIGHDGIKISHATGATITENKIFNIITTASTPVGLTLSTGVISSEISKNNIYNITYTGSASYAGRGMYVNTGSGTSNLSIVNNVVHTIGGDGWTSFSNSSMVGIYIDGSTGGLDIFYNSVNLNGTYSKGGNTITAAILFNSSSITDINLRDNVFVNTFDNTASTTDKNYAIYSSAANTAFTTINYNDYFVGSTSGVLGFISSDRTDLTAIKTGFGQNTNSKNADPLFTTNSNLLPQSGSPLISAATPIAGVTDDIDGVTRHATLPTIGAYEMPACTGAVGGTATANGTDTYCGSGTPNITCSGYSIGINTTYQWQYSNDNFVADINNFSGQTNPAALTTGVVSAITCYRLKVTCNTGLATDYSNVITINIKPVPTASASSNSPICTGSNLNLTGTTDIGTSFAWTGPNSFISSDQNPTITGATTAASGAYSFIATLNGCSSAAGTTSVTLNPAPTSVTASASSNNICQGSTVNLFSSSNNTFNHTYISPTGDGGFETGSTFILNNWTVVNGTYNNWFVGTAAGVQGGVNAAYAGTNFVGTNNASVNHFYTDYAIPSGSTDMNLNFYLKMPIIDNTWDYLYVYYTTTSNTPAVGIVPSSGYTQLLAYTTPALANYTLQSVTLPNALAGTTVRFVFTYKCDGIPPYAVPAVDYISLTANNSTLIYSWTSDPAGFTSTDQNPVNVSPNTTTDYLVTVQNSYNCTASASTNLVVDNPSAGGTITPSSATINGGQSTGNLDLSLYTGSIVKWQRNFALMGWSDIPSTSGLNTYAEVPSSSGSWQYRAVVQNGVCASANSAVSDITVNTTGTTTFAGTIDSDWNTPGNWDNGVPGAYLNACIPANKLSEVNTAASKCYNLTIEPLGMLTVNNGADLQVAGTMTVQASATGMGSVIDNGTLTTGSNLIQRWVSTNGSSHWEYVSAPVAAASSSLFTTATRSLWYADETLNAWASITNASPANLNVMKGYVRKFVQGEGDGNTTVNFTGSLNTGAKSIALTRTESAPGAQHGWNLAGNPYPSTMDWDAVSGWTKTNVDDGIYFRTNGNFASYVAGVGTNGGTKYIPPMQAFWVRVTAGQTTGTLGSNQSVRVHHDHNIYKSYPALDNNLSLTVTNINNNMSDETYLRFGLYATDGFDGAYDAYKMQGADSIYPQIYTNIDGTDDLSINSRNTLLGELIIPLGFTTFVAGQFTFNADMVSTFTSNGNTVYLKDLFTGNTQNLALNNAYQFTSGIAGGLNRFVLHFNPATVSINEVTGNTIQIYSHKNEIFISGDEILDGEVYIYDMPGKLVLTQKISGVKNTSVILNTAGGVYIVKYISAEESSARKVYINQ